jgi:transcriptional regulator with XRE-family HTH domain
MKDNKLGKRIKKIRVARDLNQKELARLAGVSTLTVRGLELGYPAQANPGLDTLRRLAAALRCDVSEVVQ